MDSIRCEATYQAPELLAEAWALPVAKLYSPLLSQGHTSICGPTSVANVLRSMGRPSGRNPLRGLGLRPMSLDQLAAEAAEVVPPGWHVRAVRPRSLDELRAELRASNDPSLRYVANFARTPLFGRGGGHHSPIGGYLEAEDLAFVLDVNARFGPWLVGSARLFEALGAVADRATGKTRGLARFERDPLTSSACMRPGASAR
ncbi:MAG: phytochelatin synthase family protein [Myxococcales bacterium]